MPWLSLLGWIALCFAGARISGTWTARDLRDWYRMLRRPSFSTSNWIFVPVWSAICLMLAIAAWIVWELPGSPHRSLAIALFLAQLMQNFVWPWIFFDKHALGAAAIVIVLLLIAAAGTVWAFMGLTAVAGWLMVPYLVWVGFATLLSLEFWRLNR